MIDEENYITFLKKKDEKALGYVIDTYGWIIKYEVKRQLYGLESFQEECINDIFMAIWENSHSFDPKRSSFKNWIYGIARFKAIDYKRKYLKGVSYDNIDDLDLSVSDNTSLEITRNELDIEIEKLLGCLKVEDRNILKELYVEERDLEDVAKEHGFKIEAIYNKISRAKKRLKLEKKLVERNG